MMIAATESTDGSTEYATPIHLRLNFAQLYKLRKTKNNNHYQLQMLNLHFPRHLFMSA